MSYQSCPVWFMHMRLSLGRGQLFNNSPTHFLLRENYFPLTLTLSPMGGEGKKWHQCIAL
jgi:hypothetical protein